MEGAGLPTAICSNLVLWGLGSGTIVLKKKKTKNQNPNNLTTQPPPELSFSCVCFQIVKHQAEIEVLLVSYACAV